MQIDILKYKDKVRFNRNMKGEIFLYSLVRNKWLAYTDEEFCRQCLVCFLKEEYDFSTHLMMEEAKVNVNGRSLRLDLLVYKNDGEPFLLVELKSFKVPLKVDVFLQSKQYVESSKAKYLLVTNGNESFLWQYEASNQAFILLDHFPKSWRTD